MRETRRRFALALAAVPGCLAARETPAFAQRCRAFPDPPEPAKRKNPADAAPEASGHQSARRALHEKEREFRAGIERLYQLTSELRDEVQKTVTSDVLSIHIYKKTEEIEKLAKQLKTKLKANAPPVPSLFD
jgi:hypothetical protein